MLKAGGDLRRSNPGFFSDTAKAWMAIWYSKGVSQTKEERSEVGPGREQVSWCGSFAGANFLNTMGRSYLRSVLRVCVHAFVTRNARVRGKVCECACIQACVGVCVDVSEIRV